MNEPNDNAVTFTPTASADSLMYDAVLRAEAAEQERDKLLKTIHAAIIVLNEMEPGRFDKQVVADMLGRIIKEGGKSDGE
ncbi:hypothetical protein [Paenibacillus wenxiniae]|uniref:Uncharacterized protein n=1 Tax=Paenibacillus wenxiniae TaxID=1636843 RepID=A0ABW4RCP7_9BACL